MELFRLQLQGALGTDVAADEVTFVVEVPGQGEPLCLPGLDSYGVASYCAAIRAALEAKRAAAGRGFPMPPPSCPASVPPSPELQPPLSAVAAETTGSQGRDPLSDSGGSSSACGEDDWIELLCAVADMLEGSEDAPQPQSPMPAHQRSNNSAPFVAWVCPSTSLAPPPVPDVLPVPATLTSPGLLMRDTAPLEASRDQAGERPRALQRPHPQASSHAQGQPAARAHGAAVAPPRLRVVDVGCLAGSASTRVGGGPPSPTAAAARAPGPDLVVPPWPLRGLRLKRPCSLLSNAGSGAGLTGTATGADSGSSGDGRLAWAAAFARRADSALRSSSSGAPGRVQGCIAAAMGSHGDRYSIARINSWQTSWLNETAASLEKEPVSPGWAPYYTRSYVA
ncbi:hypothetical protein HYH03_013960 [Edaphochlamys debaryana]|uniref:Uncharacterized protein n=1 Tax=Edaphochlamys debaryana TaxID=47281 RepID=A0A836BSD9_9CHLO|nr:hypothetical protein HYH03_013960 [Edaphochlamys debaryana]|eukprot:KAG2487391.1 hypothetical protein HYH03_013960 [Edaphochlamys debaryana]